MEKIRTTEAPELKAHETRVVLKTRRFPGLVS